MKKNMGIIDRTIRVLIALGLIGLLCAGIITGPLSMILTAFAVIFILTSALAFCPLYLPFGIKTGKSCDSKSGSCCG